MSALMLLLLSLAAGCPPSTFVLPPESAEPSFEEWNDCGETPQCPFFSEKELASLRISAINYAFPLLKAGSLDELSAHAHVLFKSQSALQLGGAGVFQGPEEITDAIAPLILNATFEVARLPAGAYDAAAGLACVALRAWPCVPRLQLAFMKIS